MRTRVLIDVDTGIDDALALLYAIAHPDLEVVAVTCVSGNVALSQVVINTCSVLGFAGAQGMTVGAGADATLRGNGPRAGHQHGANGLGDLRLPSSIPQARVGAVELMRRRILDAEGPVTIVALAPQTNIATLLRDHLDQVATVIERLIFVGGRLSEPYPPEPAEFNVGHDPEAAGIVLESGLAITMYGLDVFNQVFVSSAASDALAEQKRPVARLAGELLRVRHGRLIGDAGALIALTNPGLFTTEPVRIRIGLDGAQRGRTLRDPASRPIDVVTAGDAVQAAQTFADVVSGRNLD
jgi:pyrimidine-specific ribonucleoside hydrolase